jgi:NAD+ kinase
LVDSAANVYRLRLFHGAQGATVVIDGQQTLPLQLGQEIVVRRAPVDFQLIKVPGQGFYQTLREKLNWGTTPNYRPEGNSQ